LALFAGQSALDLKRIIIFSAGFGEGHNTAARAIEESLVHLEPSCVVERVDLFRECYPRLERMSVRAYLLMINDAPRVWSSVYRMFDGMNRNTRWPSFRKLLKRLRQRLENPPFAMVTTYPAYPVFLRRVYGDSLPSTLHTVITDSITVNSLWHAADCDSFISPNPETTEVLLQRGMRAEKIFTLGFPVSRRFAQLQKRALPDPCKDFRILYAINSGRHRASKVVQKILEIPDVSLTVLAGRDLRLHAKLSALTERQAHRCTVLSWTDEIPRLMSEHHLLISKAGGATTQEALASALPMLVHQLVPGQEEGNLELLQKNGFGFFAPRSEKIIEFIYQLRNDNCSLWKTIRAKMAKAANPAAADRIAKHILKYRR
jgi:processive 1,2-diacylglycerol beta-glucosyltransferase